MLADKISRLIIWYSLQKRDLSDEDKNHLDSSLVECYKRYGITFENSSVVDEDGRFREMPILLPGIFWATDIANDLIMDARQDLSALIADELWSLVGANFRHYGQWTGYPKEAAESLGGGHGCF